MLNKLSLIIISFSVKAQGFEFIPVGREYSFIITIGILYVF